MASTSPARSPSNSPPSSPAVGPTQPDSPLSSARPGPSVTQPGLPSSQNLTSSQNTIPPHQNTLPIPQAPRRTSTTQTYQTTDTSHRKSSTQPLPPPGFRPSNYFERLHSAFSPSTHDLKEYVSVPQGTARPYDHRQQRKRLWLKTVTEFLITLVLCVTYFVILYTYSMDNAINTVHRRIFNALVTGNALFLGINLQASLKSYIKMLRWNILASRYRPLKIFDLILGSDSIANVIKLFWHGRNKKHPFGINLLTSRTSLLALTWLTIQLGIAVCVGLIGLTYNLNVSSNFVNTQIGNTSSIDLSTLANSEYLATLAQVNTFGLKGDFIQPFLSPTLSYNDQSNNGVVYLINDQGETRYYFVDYNPNDIQINSITRRYIDCTVSCTRSIVTRGQYGLSQQITYNNADGKPVNETLFEAPGEGGVYAVADTNSTCGDRCTNVKILQAAVTPGNADVYQALYGVYKDQGTWFSCDITVSDVQSDYYYPDFEQRYAISPQVSKILAGAYGWSANPLKGNRYIYQTYEVASELALQWVPSTGDMVQQISSFTMDGIVSMDDPTVGWERQYVTDGYQPVQAQMLSVMWWATAALLGAIPLVQFLTWMAVIGTANRVIIKDDSPLSMAKVYWTLLRDNLGQHGCMLDNDQLITEVGKAKVIYGYREAEGDGPGEQKHVDVFEEGKGCLPARSFPQGEYDGSGVEGLKKRRDFDARAYF